MHRPMLLTWIVAFAACPPQPATDDRDSNDETETIHGRFGEVTSAVVVVNPVINTGSPTSIATGTTRSGIFVAAGEGAARETDDTGLVLLEELPVGTVPIAFETGRVDLAVLAARELYDVIVAYTPQGVQHIVEPVRYPIAGTLTPLEPGADLASAAQTDGAIIRLLPGRYSGNIELRGTNVLIFGAWSAIDGPLSIIDGDVRVLGGGNRIRGVDIRGRLTSNANNFSAAFCTVAAATITGNGVTLLRNTFTEGQATVPSGNAILVDNRGIP